MTPFCVTTANQCADMWKMAMALLYAMSIIIISLYYFMHATRVCIHMGVYVCVSVSVWVCVCVWVCLPYTFCDCVCSFVINLMINRLRKIYWVFAWHCQAALCGIVRQLQQPIIELRQQIFETAIQVLRVTIVKCLFNLKPSWARYDLCKTCQISASKFWQLTN